jgi:hypothetical protein
MKRASPTKAKLKRIGEIPNAKGSNHKKHRGPGAAADFWRLNL